MTYYEIVLIKKRENSSCYLGYGIIVGMVENDDTTYAVLFKDEVSIFPAKRLVPIGFKCSREDLYSGEVVHVTVIDGKGEVH